MKEHILDLYWLIRSFGLIRAVVNQHEEIWGSACDDLLAIKINNALKEKALSSGNPGYLRLLRSNDDDSQQLPGDFEKLGNQG